MDNEKYKTWLGGLKVGDEVGIKHHTLGGIQKTDITRITHITPKKRIRVQFNEEHLFQDGEYSSGGGWNSWHYKLVPVDDELKAAIKRQIQLEKIERFSEWKKLDNTAINTIFEMIQGKGKEAKP